MTDATSTDRPAPPGATVDDAHAAFMDRRHFGSLDGLRAISVVAVVWFHTMGHTLEGSLSYAGAEGVTLFFAISGFLITTLLLRERAQRGRIDLQAFYVRRALRIFPLYYATLCLYIAVVFLFERGSAVGQQFFGNLVYFATYTSNIFVALDGRVIFYLAWSLAAEEQFYALWPPLMRRLGTAGRAAAAVSVVVAVLVAAELLLPAGAATLRRFVYAVPLAILLGVWCALQLRRPRVYAALWPWLAATRWHSLAWLLIAMGVVGWLEVPRFVGHVVLTALTAACVMREDHLLGRLLAWRPVAHVGAVSYGIYLLHLLCKNVVVKVLAALGAADMRVAVVFVATLALAIAVASLSFRYFEAYFLSLKKQFAR